MKWILLLLLASTVACGGDDYCDSGWYKTSGLKICDNDLDVRPDELDFAVDTLEARAKERYDWITGLDDVFDRNEVKVVFTSKHITVECENVSDSDMYFCDGIAAGGNIGGDEIYLHYNDCLGVTAFAHELLHSIEQYYLGIISNDHDTPGFFFSGESNIESEIAAVLIYTLDRCEEFRG